MEVKGGGTRRHILENDGVGTNHRVLADRYASENNRACTKADALHENGSFAQRLYAPDAEGAILSDDATIADYARAVNDDPAFDAGLRDHQQ